jgi:hypothetical protein
MSERLGPFADQEVAVLFEAVKDLMSFKDREDMSALYMELHDEMIERGPLAKEAKL